MYSKTFPFKDFNDKPRNETAHFNLTEREVFKLLPEFKMVFDWQESMAGEMRELPTEEVIEYYNAFEKILLEAWGVPSSDGLHFRKGGKYEFEESALFNACMVEFVSNPPETSKLVKAIMPTGLDEIVRKQAAALEEAGSDENIPESVKRELAELRARAMAADVKTDE